MARTCPNCGGSMEPETIHGVTLDVCTVCKGAWLTGSELNALLTSGPLSADEVKHLNDDDVTVEKHGASKMVCPDHGVALDTYHYLYNSPLVIHSCPTDGAMFVAAGEIEQMEAWRAHAADAPTGAAAMTEDMATLGVESIQSQARSRNFLTFFGILNRWSAGWSGLL